MERERKLVRYCQISKSHTFLNIYKSAIEQYYLKIEN